MTVRPKINPGPVTLLRLYGAQCDQMHVALGELLGSDQSPDFVDKSQAQGGSLGISRSVLWKSPCGNQWRYPQGIKIAWQMAGDYDT